MMSNIIYRKLETQIIACENAISALNVIESSSTPVMNKLLIVHGELAAIIAISKKKIEQGLAYEAMSNRQSEKELSNK